MINTKQALSIILSRTDSIGDVVLTLPMAGFIKKHYPNAKIIFLGKTYTQEVVKLSKFVDEFINYDLLLTLPEAEQIKQIQNLKADTIVHVLPNKHLANLAKKSKIPLIRVGTTNRLFHWNTCNKLIPLSRKKSELHEAQLNIKLLSFLPIDTNISLTEIPNYYGFSNIPILHSELAQLIDKTKYSVILHPKSKGSAREWGVDNYASLISILPPNKYQVFIGGTAEDASKIMNLTSLPNVVNLTGKMSLDQYIAFIANCDALVAASTGPLHIAAALGRNAVGLFSPMRPIHPGRWMPIGVNSHYLVFDENCTKCQSRKPCNCIEQIAPEKVKALLH